MSYGPWGGSGGMLFDDGVFTGVREIHLSRTATGGVVSIRVCYDMNGQAVWGNKNGGTGAIRVDKVKYSDKISVAILQLLVYQVCKSTTYSQHFLG